MIIEEEFTQQVLAGWTIKQLQEHYGISRSNVYTYKTKWNLVGKTPNGKAIKPSEEGLKTCATCKQEKPFEAFYANGYQPNGKKKYKSTCKQCQTPLDYKRKKDRISNILLDLGKEYECERCGYNKNTAALCFHHLDPNQKDFEIANLSAYPKDLLEEEISKCIVLCHNCHMEEHYPHLNK